MDYLFRLGLHDTICLADFFVFTLGHCLKTITYESASLDLGRQVAPCNHGLTIVFHFSWLNQENHCRIFLSESELFYFLFLFIFLLFVYLGLL